MQSMKKSHVYLFTGAGLLVSGIAIAAIMASQIESSFIEKTEDLVKEATIGPGEEYLLASNSARVGEKFSVIVDYEPKDVPVTAQVKDPDGKAILEFAPTAGSPGQFSATKSGVYGLAVKNEGSQAIVAHLTLISIGVISDEEIEFNPLFNEIFAALAWFVVAGVLALVGIIMLIIGSVKFFRERRSESPKSQA